jgi:hypothetical protein
MSTQTEVLAFLIKKGQFKETTNPTATKKDEE